jgi:hypothetical protein
MAGLPGYPSPLPPGDPPSGPRRPPVRVSLTVSLGLEVWVPGSPAPRGRGGIGAGGVPPRPSRPRPRNLYMLMTITDPPGSLPLPSTPPLPGWLQGAMGGPAVGEARRQPPAITLNRRSRAIGRRPDPGLPSPWERPGRGAAPASPAAIAPRPPGRRLTGNGGLY